MSTMTAIRIADLNDAAFTLAALEHALHVASKRVVEAELANVKAYRQRELDRAWEAANDALYAFRQELRKTMSPAERKAVDHLANQFLSGVQG